MNSIGKDIFRSIHEGKWLYVEYQNSEEERTKYWISINNINTEKRSLEVTGLHLGKFETKELYMFIDKIIFTEIMDGTFYYTNKDLIEDIELFPQKYSFVFSNIVNLKTLNYLADCNKLADLPKLNNDYVLIKKLDASKIQNQRYKLDDEQFKYIVNSFKKTATIKKEKNINSIIQLALNVLSVHTPKGLYVLAYKEVKFDVAKRSLLAGNKIKICTEFCVDGTTTQSIQNFVQPEEIEFLENIDQIPEGSFEHENSIYMTSIDLSYNKLKDLPREIHAVNLPYLYGVELSFNCFEHFPFEPLDSFYLTVLGIRSQRNAKGERCLREWPQGIYNHTGLRGLYIGSNDLRKIDDTISTLIYYLDISDNPNIIFDASDICYAWQAGAYFLIYDKSQTILNCDAMVE